MGKFANIKTLTHQEEIELLHRAKEGRTKYDILGLSHDGLEKEITKSYNEKLTKILGTYLGKEKFEKEIKEKEITKSYNEKLTKILGTYLEEEKDEKKKAELEEIIDAYRVLSNEKQKNIYDRKNKDLFLRRENAIRLLVWYNRSFIKYLVGGFYYLQSEISPEDLVTEGSIALFKAIKKFDLSLAEKYRLASFAGHQIRQQIHAFIKKSHFIPQAARKKTSFVEDDDLLEDEKKVPQKKSWGIIYIDRNYRDTEKDDKTTSLLDTLSSNSEQIEQQIQREEDRRKLNKLISQLDYHEELIIRLFFGVAPTNSDQIIRLATKEKAEKLKKVKIKKKSTFLGEEKPHSLLERYHDFLVTPHKKEEVLREFSHPEFWEYFREFPELALKTESSRRTSDKKPKSIKKTICPAEKKKWKESLSEQEILRWINLGYQPEEVDDPQNQILYKLGVSKKEKEQWKKTGSKIKTENWFGLRLGKVLDNRKKILLEKLKQFNEKK